MPSYEVALKGHEAIAEGTRAFHFEKPAGFAFKPGQSATFELLEPPPEPNSAKRIFSLASAPFEDELVIATRMRDGSAFKRALAAASPGAKVRLKGPRGTMTLHEDRARPAVLVAGGIGITPFMSMLRQAAHDALDQRLVLLYSNRRPEDAAFLAELQELERRNPRFRLHATMTDMEKSARQWHGERGMIDDEKVKRVVGAERAPVCYVAGPPAMVAAMQAALRRAGVPDEDLHGEEFYGY